MQSVAQTYAALRRFEKIARLLCQRLNVSRKLWRAEEIDFFLGKIERGFEPRAHAHDRIEQRLHAIGKFALETSHRGACASFAAAGDQIGDRFGLRQIELAVEKCAFGEFAGPRRTSAESERATQKLVEHDRTSVRMKFDDILAGERPRRREVNGETAIERLFVAGIK